MPSDAPQKRTLAEAIRRAVGLGLADAHVSIPARVTRVDRASNLVDAQPLIMDIVEPSGGGRLVVPFPVVTNVPIFSASGGGFRLTFPVAAGDIVTILFADRSIDFWLGGAAGPVDPVDPRAHALSDGVVAIPSINPSAPWSIRANAATLGMEGGPLVVLEAGNIRLDDGDQAVAREGDRARAATSMLQWINAVTGALSGSGAAARIPGLVAPVDFGVVDEGAARVKA